MQKIYFLVGTLEATHLFLNFRESEFKFGIKLFEISYCALEIEAWEGGYFVSSVPRCLHKMQEQFQTILQLVYHHLPSQYCRGVDSFLNPGGGHCWQ